MSFVRLGRLIVRRRRTVLAAWAIVFVIGSAMAGPGIASLRTARAVEPGTEAAAALAAQRTTGVGANAVTAVIPGDPRRPALARRLVALDGELRGIPGVTFVADAARSGRAMVARDDQSSAAVVLIDTHLSSAASERVLDAVTARIHRLAGAQVGGDLAAAAQIRTVATQNAAAAEKVSTPLTLLAMTLIFGGLVAATMPLAVAGAAIVCALTALWGLTHLFGVATFAQNIVTLLGLGLGIDYGLLAVHRFRELRGAGVDVDDAVAGTVATAGRTIAVSALTVTISMCGLLFIPTDDMQSLALGGALVTAFAALAAVTLLPALLGCCHRWIKPTAPAAGDGGFARLARVVGRHPVLLGGAAVAILVVLAWPALSMRTQLADERFLPAGNEVRQVEQTIRVHYPALASSPVVVVAQTEAGGAAGRHLEQQVAALPGVQSVRPQLDPFPRSRPMVLLVSVDGGEQSPAAVAVVHEVRALQPGFAVLTGGTASQLVDSTASLARRLPEAIGFVMIATFVLLWLFTGSVVLPVKALAMNVLSIGATFGVTVWVFQQGHLAGFLGVTPSGALELTAPVMIFLFAFGLSMDYEVFLLSRIKEEYDRHGDNDRAVAVGLQQVGRLITSAALLIVLVLLVAGLTATMLTNQAFAFGLAVAVVVDATIVRSVLVPAAMSLMGRFNWWSPAPLRRLHHRLGLVESWAPAPPVAEPLSAQPAAS